MLLSPRTKPVQVISLISNNQHTISFGPTDPGIKFPIRPVHLNEQVKH